MRPELINRIDKIMVFKPLGMDEIKKIVAIELAKLNEHTEKQQKIKLLVDKEVVKLIAEKSYDPSQGARFIRRKIQELIEDPLAEKIISGEITPDSEVKISLNGEYIQIKQMDLAKA